MTTHDEKKQLNGGIPSKPKKFLRAETLLKVKSIASHVGLLVTLMIYTLIGGLVFRRLELPAEFSRLNGLKETLLLKRQELITSVDSKNITSVEEWEQLTLRPYELAVQEAARSGFSMSLIPNLTASSDDVSSSEQPFADRWSVVQAVFFASTILTTIGYGNVFPSTFNGRIFCILFALIGIPLTLTVIADYGSLLAEGVSSVAPKIRSRLPKGWNSCVPSNHAGRKSLGALAAVALLFLYLACGAALFMLWEKNWTFFEGFYFCFVTMTTIGFGDVVPTNPKYMLFCTGYILVGLALTSTIIELVRRQYAHSWKRLQALSGPLADTLKKLGEQAGGDMSALQNDLKRVLKVISMPRRRKSGAGNNDMKDQEWEKAVEAILRDIAGSNNQQGPNSKPERKKSLQIIFYESSV